MSSNGPILIGAVIMFLSGAITSYANILMKLDALALRHEPNPGFIITRRFVVMAVSLYVIGGLADLVALGLVPLSLRACTSVLTIPFNAVFAKSKLGEAMSRLQIIGAAITVFACLVAMLFASQQTVPDDLVIPRGKVIDDIFSRRVGLFTLWTVPFAIVCIIIVQRALPRRGTEAVSVKTPGRRLAVLAASTMSTAYQCGWTNLFIKAIAVLVQEEGWEWKYVIGLALATGISAIGQMILMSGMMQLFESVVVIPPYQILITLWIVVFSSVVFRDHPSNLIGFVLSLLFSFFGILLIALSPSPSPPQSPDREPLVMMTERI